ncbi:MAG: sulfatase/phosphatase domain-containing protein [Planctomycetota bacterium]|jgi:arylsulfatase A-like enzyme
MKRREFIRTAGLAAGAAALPRIAMAAPRKRPNIVFIMADDHASHAMTCYGSRINKTPNLDRIAAGGMRLDNCFCTNSICGPSRAAILTGKYSHVNGFSRNGNTFDGTQQTFPKLLQRAGYQTAMIGKWHLRSSPTGFDYWNVLPGQGAYHNPVLIDMGRKKKHAGYVTDIITDFTMDWIRDGRDGAKPFCVMYHHKAPHRNWQPDAKHAKMYDGVDIPLPETFDDDWSNRSAAAGSTTMTIERHLTRSDVKGSPPPGLKGEARKRWLYQRYIKDYLRCVASIDDNVGRFLDFLDREGLAENTIVVYTSDQGFYLGDHGWYDKRFIYEESLRMPFVVRYPEGIEPGTVSKSLALNVDFGPTFLDYAGVETPEDMQGVSFRRVLEGRTPADWRKSCYYHYYEYPAVHSVKRHYGLRTDRYKLVHFYHDIDAWELFDLREDPNEMKSVYDDPASAAVVTELKAELERLRTELGDSDELAWRIGGGGPAIPASKGPQITLRFGEPAGAAVAANTASKRRVLRYHGTRPARGPDGGSAREFNGRGDYLDLAGNLCPSPAKTSVRVSAHVKPAKPDCVILAHGGESWGYCLHITGGRFAFSTRVADKLTTVRAPAKAADGWTSVTGVLGKKGEMQLLVENKVVASGKAPGPIAQKPNDNLQVGADRGSAILVGGGGFYGGLMSEVSLDFGSDD